MAAGDEDPAPASSLCLGDRLLKRLLRRPRAVTADHDRLCHPAPLSSAVGHTVPGGSAKNTGAATLVFADDPAVLVGCGEGTNAIPAAGPAHPADVQRTRRFGGQDRGHSRVGPWAPRPEHRVAVIP
jgi:hypothetical protein